MELIKKPFDKLSFDEIKERLERQERLDENHRKRTREYEARMRQKKMNDPNYVKPKLGRPKKIQPQPADTQAA